MDSWKSNFTYVIVFDLLSSFVRLDNIPILQMRKLNPLEGDLVAQLPGDQANLAFGYEV